MEYEFKPLTKKKGFTVLQNIFVVGYIIAIQVYSLFVVRNRLTQGFNSCRITYLVFGIVLLRKCFENHKKLDLQKTTIVTSVLHSICFS